MNEWAISGNDDLYQINKRDLATGEEHAFVAENSMKLSNAFRYVLDQASPGDIFVFPNGSKFSYSTITGRA